MCARSSAMVIKLTTAHIFPYRRCPASIGSARSLEQLTEDHRVVVFVAAELSGPRAGHQSPDRNRLLRAQVEGDVFLLATDGVYEHVSARFIAKRSADARERPGPRRRADRRGGQPAGQPRQPDRPDRPHR